MLNHPSRLTRGFTASLTVGLLADCSLPTADSPWQFSFGAPTAHCPLLTAHCSGMRCFPKAYRSLKIKLNSQ